LNDSFKASERLLSPTVVADRTSLSRVTLWRMMRRKEFPKSVLISPGRIAWPESEINAWIAARLSQSAEGAK